MDLYHGLELPNAENRPILAEKIAPVRPSSNPVVNTTPNNSTSKRKRLTEDFDLEVSLNKLQRCMRRKRIALNFRIDEELDTGRNHTL
ncbi:hypothetical protein ABG067_003779 [Albugo candida]